MNHQTKPIAGFVQSITERFTPAFFLGKVSRSWPRLFTKRRIQNFSLLGWFLVSSSFCMWGQTLDLETKSREKSLDAVEINILGRKYPNLPTGKRLDHLESTLNISSSTRQANDKNSPKYRINQVMHAQQNIIDEHQKQLAIKAYNHGIDESALGHTDSAMAAYQQAIQLNPGLIPAYNNLASLQEKRRLFNEAVGTYDSALRIAPKEPLLHFNLAIILEKQGQITEAYEHYHQYVQYSPNPKPQIVELVKNFDAKRIAGKTQPDYTSLATQESRGEKLIWPEDLLPVPVCIQLADPGQAAFVQNIYQDFDTWSQVTLNRLRFREVGYPDLARIVITLKPGPLMDPNNSIGHASFNSQTLDSEFPVHNLKVSIMVNTGDPNNPDLPLNFRKEQVGKLVLHELGHAIGIWGHSKDPDDIMYTHPIVSQLSQRDINTIRKLYGIR